MQALRALELVLGFPSMLKVLPGKEGTLRVEHEGGCFGVLLESGDRVNAPKAIRGGSQLHQTKNRIAYEPAADTDDDYQLVRRTWEINGIAHKLPFNLESLHVGNDDRFLALGPSSATLLDRTRAESRSLEIPDPVDLHDPVTSGSGSMIDPGVIFVPPDYIVFVRARALLVVRSSELAGAITTDHVEWNIVARLPLREPTRAVPARLGKYSQDTVVTETGTLELAVVADPVRARDLLWPPCGWATVELDDGTSTPAHAVPADRRQRTKVTVRPLLRFVPDVPRRVTWHFSGPIEPPPPPPVGFEDLVCPPPRTADEAIAYAESVALAARSGAYGPMTDALDQLADLRDEDEDVRADAVTDWIWSALLHQNSLFTGTAYAVPALIAIAADPATSGRHVIVGALASIAAAALADRDPSAVGVRYAFRLCLPVLLELTDASDKLVAAWSVLVAIVARFEDEPRWFDAALGSCEHLEAIDPDDLERQLS